LPIEWDGSALGESHSELWTGSSRVDLFRAKRWRLLFPFFLHPLLWRIQSVCVDGGKGFCRCTV